jgi:SsrA-binding protein
VAEINGRKDGTRRRGFRLHAYAANCAVRAWHPSGAYTTGMNQKPKSTKVDAKEAKVDGGKLAPRISNRRAFYDYHILDKVEAGIQLVGSEVKSVRLGHVQLAQAFARIRNGEVWLYGSHIDEYIEANQLNHDPTRTRRLLLHKREIKRLEHRMQKEGKATLIPLEIYFKRGFAKVLLGIAKGKQEFDKRAAIKDREDKRNIAKAMRRE